MSLPDIFSPVTGLRWYFLRKGTMFMISKQFPAGSQHGSSNGDSEMAQHSNGSFLKARLLFARCQPKQGLSSLGSPSTPVHGAAACRHHVRLERPRKIDVVTI